MFQFARNQPEDTSWMSLKEGDQVIVKDFNFTGELLLIDPEGTYLVKLDHSGVVVGYDGDMLTKVSTRVDEKKEGK